MKRRTVAVWWCWRALSWRICLLPGAAANRAPACAAGHGGQESFRQYPHGHRSAHAAARQRTKASNQEDGDRQRQPSCTGTSMPLCGYRAMPVEHGEATASRSRMPARTRSVPTSSHGAPTPTRAIAREHRQHGHRMGAHEIAGAAENDVTFALRRGRAARRDTVDDSPSRTEFGSTGYPRRTAELHPGDHRVVACADGSDSCGGISRRCSAVMNALDGKPSSATTVLVHQTDEAFTASPVEIRAEANSYTTAKHILLKTIDAQAAAEE